MWHIVFFEGIFDRKKFRDWPSKWICSFLWWLFLFNPFQQIVHFFHWWSYSIGFVIKNQSFPHLNSWIYSNYWILITKHTMHYLCVNQINFCIVIDTKKTPTYRCFTMWFLNFLWACNFFKLSFIIFSLQFSRFLLVSIWTLEFSSDLSSKITSFIHIPIVSLFPLITFSFAEDYSIGNLQDHVQR